MDASGSKTDSGKPDVVVELNIVDILDYVGESVRPIREGYAVFAAKHIVCIGYRKSEGSVTEVTAYVTQTSHPGDAPHEVQLKLTSEVAQWRLKCSCRSGGGKCKHILACLLQIDRHPTLEYVSVTDVKQAWGITKGRETIPWRAQKVIDLCCVNKPLKLMFRDNITGQEIEDQLLSLSFNRILSVSKHSAVSKHMAGRYLNELRMYPNRAVQSAGEQNSNYLDEVELRSQLAATTTQLEVDQYSAGSQELTEYFENTVVVDLNSIIRIALDTQTQSTNEWKIHRSMRITASSAYTLFTYLKNKNPDWPKKLSQYWETKNLNVKATKYGKDTEPLAFECYKLKHNPHVKKCGLVVHPTENWVAGSPDGVDCQSSVLLEIKCPGNEHSSLDELMETPAVRKYINTNAANEVSLKQNHVYYCQVQINMWILNCPTCDFIIYSKKDNDFCIIKVPFDVTYTSNIVNCLKKLYFDRMLTVLRSGRA